MELHGTDTKILQWVMKACAKEPGRYAITGVQMDVGTTGTAHLIATDGKRLHMAKLNGEYKTEDAGLYEVAKCGTGKNAKFILSRMEGVFPKWKQVVPNYDVITGGRKMNLGACDSDKAYIAGYSILMEFKAAVNPAYLADVFAFDSYGWCVQGNGYDKPVLMRIIDKATVVIMPVSDKEWPYTMTEAKVEDEPEAVESEAPPASEPVPETVEAPPVVVPVEERDHHGRPATWAGHPIEEPAEACVF